MFWKSAFLASIWKYLGHFGAIFAIIVIFWVIFGGILSILLKFRVNFLLDLYVCFQVRFFNLTLSAGVVSVCLSSVCYHWVFLSGSIYSRVHVVKWSLWGISWTMPKDFSKFSFLPLFWVKNSKKMAQKWHFCTKCWGLFSWSHL